MVFWWFSASLIFWMPISITGLFGPRGVVAFHLCQAWVRLGSTVTGIRFSMAGNAQLDRSRSYVIVANHQSIYDIPALMLQLGVPFRWVIKKEVRLVPMFGWGLYAARHIFIDRSQPKAAIQNLNNAVSALPKGISVAIFPEGSRSADGTLKTFKKGAFLAAIHAGLPILPVTVNGSWRTMPDKNALDFYPGPVQVHIGTPIETSAYTRDTLSDLIQAAQDAVAQHLDPDYPHPRQAPHPKPAVDG